MKTVAVILLLVAGNAWAGDWFEESQNQYAIQQAARAQVEATRQAAAMQAEAMNAQTEAIRSAAFNADLDNQRAYNLQLLKTAIAAKAQEEECSFSRLEYAGGSGVYIKDGNGKSIGPLYIKKCGGN